MHSPAPYIPVLKLDRGFRVPFLTHVGVPRNSVLSTTVFAFCWGVTKNAASQPEQCHADSRLRVATIRVRPENWDVSTG